MQAHAHAHLLHSSLVVAKFGPNNHGGHCASPKLSSRVAFHLAFVYHEIRQHRSWWIGQHLQGARVDELVDPVSQEHKQNVDGLVKLIALCDILLWCNEFNFVLKSGLLSQRIHKNSLKREKKNP